MKKQAVIGAPMSSIVGVPLSKKCGGMSSGITFLGLKAIPGSRSGRSVFIEATRLYIKQQQKR